MQAWLAAQVDCEKHHRAYVLVSITHVAGSSPRSLGAKMLVTSAAIYGSIGGGHLEHKATQQARNLLLQNTPTYLCQTQTYALGANLGQCCGGQVSVLFEYHATQHMPVMVFGAGHVGRALVPLLAQMPVAVTWVDGRYGMLPKTLPEGVTGRQENQPVDAIADGLPNSCYLIMTHHHGLDLQLAEAALKRNDGIYVGVIGSKTKGIKFRHRLQAKGLLPTDNAEDNSVGIFACPFACPMGQAHIQGKLPIEVAVSVAAKVMDLYQQQQVTDHTLPAQSKRLETANEDDGL